MGKQTSPSRHRKDWRRLGLAGCPPQLETSQSECVHPAFIGRPPGAAMPHRCNSIGTAEFTRGAAGALKSRVTECQYDDT